MTSTESRTNDQQGTQLERDVETMERAPTGELGSTTVHGRHYPTISQRKPRSTVALLRRARDLRAIYLERRLDPAFREEVMLAVAGANSCRQCSFAHREWALAEGLSKADLAALEGLDAESFDARTWAAIAWAQAYARSDFATVPDAIDANFRQRFSAQEQADIQLIVRLMYWMNETSNSVRAALRRMKGDPVRGSSVPRELEALLLYLVGAPLVLIVVSRQATTRPHLACSARSGRSSANSRGGLRTRSPDPGSTSATRPRRDKPCLGSSGAGPPGCLAQRARERRTTASTRSRWATLRLRRAARTASSMPLHGAWPCGKANDGWKARGRVSHQTTFPGGGRRSSSASCSLRVVPYRYGHGAPGVSGPPRHARRPCR